MKLELRSPRDNEWPICRMLLPETFGDAASREYLLCLRDASPSLVAAVSFRRGPEGITHFRLHVIPSLRRRGFGSQIVEHLASSGVSALSGAAEIARDAGNDSFCKHNRFERVDALTTVE